MDWALGTMSASPNIGIQIHDHLTDDEAGQLEQATIELIDFQNTANLFVLLLWNHQDYLDMQQTYLKSYVSKSLAVFDKRPIQLNLNRSLMNYLTSVRSYKDYLYARMKRKYGRNSPEFEQIRRQHDNASKDHFAYRFVSGLRDYAQHNAMPLTYLSMGREIVRKNPLRMTFYIEVGIYRDTLVRNNFSWKEPLKSEVSHLPEVIEIDHYLNDFMDILTNLHRQFLIDESPRLLNSAKFVSDLAKRVECEEGEVLHLLGLPDDYIIQEDGNQKLNLKTLTQREIPVYLAEALLDGSFLRNLPSSDT